MQDDSFLLPVHWQGNDYNFPARLLQYGYTVKVEVETEGQVLLFEPDEERNWRAVVPFENIGDTKPVSPALLQAIAETLETLTKG